MSGVRERHKGIVVSERPEKVRRFTDLDVWRMSHELFLDLMVDLEGLPRTRVASVLTDQLIRSLGSVGANIAEGFNRSKAKYLNCIDIALGEANETENWLYKIRDAKLLARESANSHVLRIIQVEKMLTALHRSISKKSP